jgi:O-antigen/teichoic acid export membrane protein
MAGAIPPFVLAVIWVGPYIGTRIRLSVAAASALLSYGSRSFGVDLLGTLALQVDQVLVISLLPAAGMGTYGVVLSLSRMFNLFQASVVMVLFPKATGAPVERVLELTERSARISTIVTAACCGVVALFGSLALRLLYGAQYAANTATLRLLLLEVTISGAVFILAQAFMAIGHPGVVTVLQGLGLALSIPLMLWLIPKLGVEGAALALLISTLARFTFVYLGFPLLLKTRLPRLVPTRDDVRFITGAARSVMARFSSSPASL